MNTIVSRGCTLLAYCKKTRHSTLHQSGISLIFALLTLAALSLAAIALVRSVDTGALVLGNLGFKQDTARAGDQSIRDAIKWLNGAAALTADLPDQGYYATSRSGVDVTGQQSSSVKRALVDWDDDNCASATDGSFATCDLRPAASVKIDDATTAQYVIFRLCLIEGAVGDSGNSCVRPADAGDGESSKKGSASYRDPYRYTASGSGVYYRIVARVIGPRNTTSYIEALVYR